MFLVLSLPFAPRHGSSDCDRFFGHVTNWCENYIYRFQLKGYAAFEAAFKEGVKQANRKRKQKNEEEFSMYFMTSDLVEPGTKERLQLNFKGIQSTHGVTYFRDDDKVINHIYPDVDDRSDWRALEISKRPLRSTYVRFDKKGNALSNFLLPPYAELKEVVLDVTKIERTEKQRQEWEAIAKSQRLRDQPLFSLGGLSP